MNVDLAAQRAMDHLAKVGFDHLSESERILAAVWQFAAGVSNNGFAGYYTSRWADLAFYVPAALQQIGAAGLAEIDRQVVRDVMRRCVVRREQGGASDFAHFAKPSLSVRSRPFGARLS